MHHQSLGIFAKLQKATDWSFFMSVRLTVSMETFNSHFKDCYEIRYLSIFKRLPLRFTYD
jgi:hypothetical protein